MAVLQSQLSLDEATRKIAELEAKLLAEKTKKGLTLKIGQAGGLSVYGLGKWPVTLYKSQWEKLIAEIPAIQAFLVENDSLLATKK